MGEKLDESRVQKDTSAERVENTGDQGCASRARIVCRFHGKAHGDTYRCGDTVKEGAEVGYEAVFMWEDEEGEAGANPEAFEHFCDKGDE